MRASRSPALLLGLGALREAGLRAAARVAAATGAALLCEVFPTYIDRGAGRPRVEKIPYFPEQTQERLARCDALVLAGTRSPVAFFGYPGIASRVASESSEELLATPDEDAAGALSDLADALGAPAQAPPAAPAAFPEAAPGPLTPASLGAVLARSQPEGAIVVDEGATSGAAYFTAAESSPPHSYLALTGGAIGQGLPCATGAAIACPGRRVISLQADGSGLYTLQALWTQAREQLDVVTLICANRSYRILQVELARAGIAEPGAKARALTDLSHPEIDWTALARGFGVPATRVQTTQELARALTAALARSGPSLIEAML